MALTLLMARHGQTDLNIDERWQGRIDAPLNATGFAQAEQLARALPGGIQALVVSPMLRARQTAEPVARALGLAPRLDADFRERDFGVFEGLTADEATRAVVDRVARGLAQLHATHHGQTVLLVSHGFVVRCLRYLIDGVSEAEFFAVERIANGSFLTRALP